MIFSTLAFHRHSRFRIPRSAVDPRIEVRYPLPLASIFRLLVDLQIPSLASSILK
jgi:hypothetical protein